MASSASTETGLTVSSLGTVAGWDEDRTITETPRVTPATVKMTLPDIKGKITSHYLMAYTGGGNATFVFTDIVEADDFKGKSGSFFTQGSGTFDAATFSVNGTFHVIQATVKGDIVEVPVSGGSFGPAKDNRKNLEYVFELKS